MSAITRLSAQGVRNIASLDLLPDARCNLFFGENGSGKTSILEVIYLIACGRSFRVNRLESVIAQDAAGMTCFAEILAQGELHALGVERLRDGYLKARLDGESARSIAQLTQYLPVRFVDAHSHRSFFSESSVRRKLLDWLAFYWHADFQACWQQYQKALKQRNAALKQNQPFKVWDEVLVEAGERITQFRREALALMQSELEVLWQSFFPGESLCAVYNQGWGEGLSLAEALEVSRETELRFKATQVGPHRADLCILAAGSPVGSLFSQGQQKMLLQSLLIAQLRLLKHKLGKTAVVLWDDLAAEFDLHHRAVLLEALEDLGAQLWITGPVQGDMEALPIKGSKKMFHVKQGKVSEY